MKLIKIFYGLLICVVLIGCYNDKDVYIEDVSKEEEQIIIKHKEDMEIEEKNIELIESDNEKNNLESEKNLNTIALNDYVNKMWSISDGTNSKGELVIIDVSNNVLKILYSGYGLHDLNGEYEVITVEFIKESSEVHFIDKNGAKKAFDIVLNADNQNKFMLKDNDAKTEYTLINENISDLQDFNKLLNISLNASFESLGDIQVVVGDYSTGRAIYPQIYITDENNNILRYVGDGFVTGTRIVKLEIVDVNIDGLTDIVLKTQFFNYDYSGDVIKFGEPISEGEMPIIIYTFLQDKEGFFNLSQ